MAQAEEQVSIPRPPPLGPLVEPARPPSRCDAMRPRVADPKLSMDPGAVAQHTAEQSRTGKYQRER